MGCGISKQARPRARSRVLRDSKPIASLPRSYSLSAHAHHAVSLKSTTFGSMKLDSLDPNIINHEEEEEEEEEEEDDDDDDDDDDEKMPLHNTSERRREVLVQAKAWSNDVQGKMKICRTPLLRTPPNDYEPETINAWELMDGLEDSSPLPLPKYLETPKPIWADDAEEEEEDLAAADFDPEILSQFRKAPDELSPPDSRRLRSPEPPAPERSLSVRDRIRAFQERIDGKKAPPPPDPCGEESQSQNLNLQRVVIYFTSLRGVRKTYEDCCNVRTIFRSGYGVRADERDVSMHHGFRQELCGLMGTHSFGGLPRVFVKGSYVGGAEEIRRMHESGELEKLIQGCKKFEQGPGGGVVAAAACQGCGDVRFVPCDRCFGSCKLFDEDQGLFLRCPDCNENGIVCCPLCFTLRY